MIALVMFTELEEVEKLTGLSEQELWDNGFCLDDWDVGFQTDKRLEDNEYGYNWLYSQMQSYCVGCECFEYGGKYYYFVYHA